MNDSADKPEPPLPVALLEWSEVRKGALIGFATVRFGQHLVIHKCGVFAKADECWASLPSAARLDREGRQMVDAAGVRQWQQVISIADRTFAKRLSNAIIDAVRAEYLDVIEGETRNACKWTLIINSQDGS